MSWLPIVQRPARKKHKPQPAIVVLRISKAGGRFRQTVTLVFRPRLMIGAPSWLQSGRHVAAALGQGVDRGKLRVMPALQADAESWTLRGATGAGKVGPAGPTVRLVMDNVADLPSAGLPECSVALELVDGALIITLPAGMAGKAEGAPIRPPFKGLTASTGLGAGIGRATRGVAA